MVNVAIVGGGPAGLSAGLFTGKNGLDTVLFDTDGTWMHKAHLFNYPESARSAAVSSSRPLVSRLTTSGVDRYQGEEVTAVGRPATASS